MKLKIHDNVFDRNSLQLGEVIKIDELIKITIEEIDENETK